MHSGTNAGDIVGGKDGHWVCSYYDGNSIFIYDSLNSGQLHSDHHIFLNQLYPDYVLKKIPVLFPKVQRQDNNCDCGVFAIANANSLYFQKNPENMSYDTAKMRPSPFETIKKKSLICIDQTNKNEIFRELKNNTKGSTQVLQENSFFTNVSDITARNPIVKGSLLLKNDISREKQKYKRYYEENRELILKKRSEYYKKSSEVIKKRTSDSYAKKFQNNQFSKGLNPKSKPLILQFNSTFDEVQFVGEHHLTEAEIKQIILERYKLTKTNYELTES